MTVSYINLMQDEGHSASSFASSDQVAHRHNLIWQRYGQGSTPEEIAAEVGMTASHIRKILLDNGEAASASIGGVDSIWELEENQRRIAFARRAQRGARKALGLRDRLPRPSAVPAPAAAAPEAVHDAAPMPSMPNWLRITAEVGARHKLTVKVLTSPSRNRKVVMARNEAFWRLREEASLSFPQIGMKFGRDHTTVLHGYRQHAKRLASQRGAEA